MCVRVCMCVFMCEGVCVCVCVYEYVCVCVCMYNMYECMYNMYECMYNMYECRRECVFNCNNQTKELCTGNASLAPRPSPQLLSLADSLW